MSLNAYGTIVPQLRDVAGGVWTDYTHHAFVEGLRADRSRARRFSYTLCRITCSSSISRVPGRLA